MARIYSNTAHKEASAIHLLKAWQDIRGVGYEYNFTINTRVTSSYKLTLYRVSCLGVIEKAYTVFTANIDEVLEKIQKEIINEND